MHSEDILVYGSRGLEANPKALLKLRSLVKKYYETLAWSHVTLAEVRYSQEKYRLITRLTEIIYDERQDWIGVEVGIETGSVRLAKKVTPAKAAPYRVEEWPEVVEEDFAIMHDHRIIPAATSILGLPGEEDVIAIIELLDRPKDYRIPMFFAPLGVLRSGRRFLREHLTEFHVEAMRRSMHHSLKWAEDILFKPYFKGIGYIPLEVLLKMLIGYIKWRVRAVERGLEKGAWRDPMVA